jgi:uncharacterized membrane protein YhaH (DUF805 family)
MNYYLSVLRNYAVFTGRARRSEYWFFFLFNIIIAFVLGVLDGVMNLTIAQSTGVLGLIYALAVFIPGLAVLVRRLHDTGKSGWWVFIALIPIIGAIVLLVFLVLDSTPGDNQYGVNPKSVSASSVIEQVAPVAPMAAAAPIMPEAQPEALVSTPEVPPTTDNQSQV